MARWLPLLVAAMLALIGSMLAIDPAGAARVSDVRKTRHNLSATPLAITPDPRTVKAVSETQICVFCHTPHGAENIPNAPLWNRKLSGAAYTRYNSTSIDATSIDLPDGSSKLCLSCHDGTVAVGSVNVLNGQSNVSIPMTGTATGGFMPTTGSTTGFTRNLGVNLTNDHPISFTYDAALALSDGELRQPNGTLVGTRSGTNKPKLPLEDGKVQCATCHDPHLYEDNTALGSGKFLRLNRLQVNKPGGGAFSEENDMLCLACHDKAGQAWALSAHAVAEQQYKSAAATQREFPSTVKVWQAGCLNCHDTHTAEGARRLLRQGVNSSGGSAIEETCYQCHSASADSILMSVATVPNIKDDFKSPNIRMPIATADQTQGGGSEKHDIGTGSATESQRGKDFAESQALLGNRHVECTDCHNPHRVTKKRLFYASAASQDDAGTHNHTAGHTNIASGVLRGSTGVEPTAWSGAAFGSLATTFALKRGDGGDDASTAVDSAWVTREYQVCLKCHSSYAYGTTPPNLGSSLGGTPSGTNGMTQYTDQAMEFQAPHPGTTTRANSGAYKGSRAGCTTALASECGTGSCYCSAVDYQTNNWRSWHPVMAETGRTLGLRGITATSPWRAPWSGHVGSQTMYCSDCHGSNTAAGTVVPETGKPWGPHGSTNNFILKGTWTQDSGRADSATMLCLKCHDSGVYASTSETDTRNTGFYNTDRGKGNLHTYHASKISAKSGTFECTWCHVAVPHGWKNRSFLVNLNDVGPEAGQVAGTQVRKGSAWDNRGYTAAPYYLGAMLKIRNFGTSGDWKEMDCGSPTSGGKSWMRDSSESCENPI